MIYRQQGQIAAVLWDAGRRGGLRALGACGEAPPAAPVTSGVGKKKKKKEGTATKHHKLLLSSPRNTATLQVPLPNARGGTQTLDHCPFPKPYNQEQLVQHLLCGLSGTGCFLHSLQVVWANHCSYH